MDSATVWCPSCGSEYRAGTSQCADCRVALVTYRPSPAAPSRSGASGTDDDSLVELGEWSRLHAQILRRRLETAGIPVMVEFSSTSGDATGTLVVPEEHADFAWAVVNEIEVDDEVPDTSPHAYVARLEEHLAAAASLLDELRTRLDEMEADTDSR
ncbi:MAG TPA: hypothetical protein VFZ83_05065 [Acidimicrobiia bacterium]|nr:hypothetical protein [Acidimicrobiia bacterium]